MEPMVSDKHNYDSRWSEHFQNFTEDPHYWMSKILNNFSKCFGSTCRPKSRQIHQTLKMVFKNPLRASVWVFGLINDYSLKSNYVHLWSPPPPSHWYVSGPVVSSLGVAHQNYVVAHTRVGVFCWYRL